MLTVKYDSGSIFLRLLHHPAPQHFFVGSNTPPTHTTLQLRIPRRDMKIRVRFPDGQTAVVRNLRAHITFTQLVTEISKQTERNDLDGAKLVRVIAPGKSEQIETGAHDSCKPRPEDGDTLRVEPLTANRPASSSSRGQSVARARGRVASSKSSRDGIASLAGLRRSRPPPSTNAKDYDDPHDANWNPDLADPEPASKRKRTKRGRGMVLGDGSGPSRPVAPAAKKKKPKAPKLFPDALLPAEIHGTLGMDLANAASGAKGLSSKRYRSILAGALEQRQIEAQGERRFAAALANNFEVTENVQEALFSVRYRARGERAWEIDEEMPLLTQPALAAIVGNVLNAVLENPGNEDAIKMRDKMRGREMCKQSPRVFWNMVKLFGGDTDEGLKKLLPDVDWSWMRTRRRELSDKAKRNLAASDAGQE